MPSLSTFERAIQPRNAEAPVSHTPGPWIARDESKPGDDHHTPIRIYQDPATAGGFLLLFEASGDAPADQEAANVRLVAAAPDMLAILKRVLGCPMAASWLEADGGTYSAAKALVERAEGSR